jgi:muconolactone D-isomerase
MGEWRSIGLFKASNEADHKILDSLLLHNWMKVTITPLTPHPNDPKSRISQAIDN